MSEWSAPSKKIFDAADVDRFRHSIAYRNLQTVLKEIVLMVKGADIPPNTLNMALVKREGKVREPISKLEAPQCPQLPSCKNTAGIIAILSNLNDLVDEVAPLEGARRFGNLAFRTWHEKFGARVDQLLSDNLELPSKVNKKGFIEEAGYYLKNSFGSATRLDYGTGHELSFIAYIGAYLQLNLLKDITGSELLVIFCKYYDLTRRLILVYNLEPAGSHGVWGLDDHFHFIYILGAAQFNDAKAKICPPVQAVLTESVLDEYPSSNLYINALSFVHKIKQGPFNEHSPIIYDIHTTVSLWKKVLSGLLKMYDVEVLGKFPVVQHFYFGGVLYPWKDFVSGTELPFTQRSESPDKATPKFLNNDQGVRTTSGNISMTGAPWMNSTTKRPGAVMPPPSVRR